MSQPLLDLINRFGGADALPAMAAKVGLSPEQTQAAMAALMPAVAGGMAQRVETDGAQALDDDAGSAAAVGDGIDSDAATAHGDGLVGSGFGGPAGAQAVAGHAAASTGLDAGKLAALLPMVMTLAAGALGRAGSAGSSASGGGIGDMIGGMLGGSAGGVPQGGAAGTLMGMLDFDKDGNPMNDIMGLVGKLRGR